MFGLETFHIVFIVVLLVIAFVVRFFMNKAMEKARKNGIVDNGLGFGAHNNDTQTDYLYDPTCRNHVGNIFRED